MGRGSVVWGVVGMVAVGLAACGTEDPEPVVSDPCASCGEGCPAPDAQPCASDGNRYCNSCEITCRGLQVVSDNVCDDDDQGGAGTSIGSGAGGAGGSGGGGA